MIGQFYQEGFQRRDLRPKAGNVADHKADRAHEDILREQRRIYNRAIHKKNGTPKAYRPIAKPYIAPSRKPIVHTTEQLKQRAVVLADLARIKKYNRLV